MSSQNIHDFEKISMIGAYIHNSREDVINLINEYEEQYGIIDAEIASFLLSQAKSLFSASVFEILLDRDALPINKISNCLISKNDKNYYEKINILKRLTILINKNLLWKSSFSPILYKFVETYIYALHSKNNN